MNVNVIYMVLGILATTIVGYFGIKYSFKHKTLTKLIFLENGCISLFKTAVKDLDELEITYKGKRIDENLLLYKGTFFNSGNTDIDKSFIHEPLKIILPKNYEWKKIKLIDQSIGINIKYETTSNELIFYWDILKENEFFTFDSVIEYKPQISADGTEKSIDKDITKYLFKNIIFSQRIRNLKSIDKEKSPSKPIGIFQLLFFILFFLGFLLMLIYSFVGQLINPKYKIAQQLKIDTNYSYVYLIKAKSKNEVIIVDSSGQEFVKKVDPSSEIGLTGKIRTVKKNLSYRKLIIQCFLILLLLMFLFGIVNMHLKEISFYKKVKQIADKYDDFD